MEITIKISAPATSSQDISVKEEANQRELNQEALSDGGGPPAHLFRDANGVSQATDHLVVAEDTGEPAEPPVS